MGYDSGATFRKQLRLITQMPSLIEIYTNNKATRVRDIYVRRPLAMIHRCSPGSG